MKARGTERNCILSYLENKHYIYIYIYIFNKELTRKLTKPKKIDKNLEVPKMENKLYISNVNNEKTVF
jgi:hypothetical protein